MIGIQQVFVFGLSLKKDLIFVVQDLKSISTDCGFDKVD